MNRGDWSEFYAFLKVLSDRKLIAADHKLNPIPGKSYGVNKILRNDSIAARTYDVTNDSSISIQHQELATDADLVTSYIDYKVISDSVPNVFAMIKKGEGRAFDLKEVKKIADMLDYGKIKASSQHKGDMTVVIHDYVTNHDNVVDFSVKSYVGGKPTLLNAGKKSTNFLFEVVGSTVDIDKINNIEGSSKVLKRVKAINDSGANLLFHSMLSEKFQKNLRKVDSLMPIFISEYIRLYYSTKARSLQALTNEVINSERIKTLLDVPFTFDDMKYKMKQLLLNVALGMVPQTNWDGFIKADGGYIIVKEDGDIVCFHIYNISQLGEYLFLNTSFDTPSTSPKKFDHAYLFKEKGKTFMKLNFQIRF